MLQINLNFGLAILQTAKPDQATFTTSLTLL